MFTINHDETYSGSKLIPEGEYEVIVKSAFENATKGGTIYINISLVIRNDVEQPYKNKWVFHSVWKGKESGEYNMKAINTIAKSLNIPNGTKFNSLEELLQAFENKLARITIKHEEYNGKTSEKVAFWNPSKFPVCAHVFANAQTKTITDDELPF